MITPSFSLTATERVLPKLALDFTTALLDPRITFTRSGNTATYTNSSGVITAINANLPRFDYNPTTLICNGLLIEESRKNILLNSLIDGTNLLTQSVTSTATAYTLSFYGTGSIVLSGTASATVSGSGAYPNRKTYTFTPTAGTLTLTISGTVQYAQLEAGSFATSFIPTDNTAGGITRNADVATMTGTNFSDWYNATQGCFVAQTIKPISNFNATAIVLEAGDGTVSNRFSLQALASTTGVFSMATSGTGKSTTVSTGYNAAVVKAAGSYIVNNLNYAVNAVAATPVTTVSIPTVDRLYIGSLTVFGAFWNGHIQKIFYYPQAVSVAQLQAFTK